MRNDGADASAARRAAQYRQDRDRRSVFPCSAGACGVAGQGTRSWTVQRTEKNAAADEKSRGKEGCGFLFPVGQGNCGRAAQAGAIAESAAPGGRGSDGG